VTTSFARARSFVDENLWSREPLHPAPLAWARNVVQLGILVSQGFVRDHLMLRAHSLTYLTMLSIVPLLALVVTFADLVGMREQITGLIEGQIAAAVPDAAEWLLGFVRNLDFGALGPVSGAVLIGSTVMAIGGAEKALNAIWGVHKQRPWARRIPDYLAVLVVAPVLLGVAIPLRATVESQWVVQRLLEIPVFETLFAFGLSQVPLLLFIAAFAFLYWFLPNTQVRPFSAFLGGTVAAVLFIFTQVAYLSFQLGAARYNTIFGTFAAIPLFMVWLYLSWAVGLFGAELAYAHQTLARYRREVRGTPAGPAARESIGLAIALQVARAFREGAEPWTTEALSEALDVPLRTVREIVAELEESGIVLAVQSDGDPGYALGRPAEQVRVEDVLAALRGPREASIQISDVARAVNEVLREVDRGAAMAGEAYNLRDLADGLTLAPAGAAQRKAAG
jgi:membrane protein